MKVKELLEKLNQLDSEAEIEVGTFHYCTGCVDQLHYFSEIHNNKKNVASAFLGSLSLVMEITDKITEKKFIYLLDREAANQTTTYRDCLTDRISQLKQSIKNLDPKLIMSNVSQTADHPKRLPERVVEVVVDHNFKSSFPYIDVVMERGKLYFDNIHSINPKNNIGTRDRAEFPSIESLENFVDILKELQGV